MERSLYQRGVGYSYDAVKIFMPAHTGTILIVDGAGSVRVAV
jgi:hypothetical protein